MYSKTINNLIECFKKLPGVGIKTAERLALAVLELDIDTVQLFSNSIMDSKIKIRRCSLCNNLTEEELCSICIDNTRDKSTICIVEDPKNINLFEKVGTYKGLYHVLNGLISPLDEINPDDINIDVLIERVKKNDIKEIIIAVKPSIEGEITSLYIKKMLENEPVIVSRIAHGIPIGADMEYMDSLTLETALMDRKLISDNEHN